VHTAEPQVDEPAEVEMDIEKFKGFKLPFSDHIQMELIEVYRESFHFQIHKLPYFSIDNARVIYTKKV